MTKYEKGKIIKVKVTHIETYGAFVFADEQYSGLIHISEISRGFVRDINDFLKVGGIINAEILEVDQSRGHLNLSIKNLKNDNKQGKTIIETPKGFNTLKRRLPFWLDKKIKMVKNEQLTIDK